MSELWSSLERRCLYLMQGNKSLTSLLQIHAFILRNALESNVNLLTKFISSLSSVSFSTSSSRHNPLGIIQHARRVFDLRPHRDNSFLCNSMMSAYLAANQGVESLTLYRDLRRKTGFNPDNYTFTILAKCCAMNMAVTEGEEIHGGVVKFGIFSNVYTALVDMYAKFGFMDSACKVFDEMVEINQVSWTALVVVGYARCGDMNEARNLFE
ncbi:hypothetical protein K1719_004218 [Acacia pycnantha]|nr:hypothetical protein K1719_004218 [Acacia pycnantha]